MGYQKIALGTGFNWVAPTLLAIGGQGINIQQIQLLFPEGMEAQGGDNIQILDEGGASLVAYGWYPGDWINSEVDGWANEAGDALANVTFAPGQSILIDVEQEGTEVRIIGEVGDIDYVTTAVAGFNWVGNTTPVTINVQDIQLDFGDGEAQGSDNIQILDDGGSTIAAYGWYPGDWINSSVDGWANEAGDALADFTLEPGQGILIDIETAGTVITVPSAL